MTGDLPLTLDAVTTVEHAGIRWQLALVPARKMIEWEQALVRAYAPILRADNDARGEVALAQETAVAAVNEDIVRWGVIGWDGAEPPHDEVRFDGRAYRVLADRAVERLMHVRRGTLALELTEIVLKANRLTEADLVGFR